MLKRRGFFAAITALLLRPKAPTVSIEIKPTIRLNPELSELDIRDVILPAVMAELQSGLRHRRDG